MWSFLVLLTVLPSIFGEFHIQHRANCQKKRLCNGNLMCAWVCERGTVQVDNWIVNSLNYQRQLQLTDKMVFFEMPATHNSAITEADGYGIEKYFISALFDGRNFDQGDDVGEGVCQYLSLTDQLRMGIRHLEVDIWWGPLEKEVQVCHSPVPFYPVGNITRTAEDKGIDLQWDPKYLSCLGTKRSLTEVLTEVKDWMSLPENSEEIIMIYYDTKFYLSPEQVEQSNTIMKDIFGSWIYKAQDGNPLLKYTIQDFLQSGKRIMFENQKECWTNSTSSEQIVFYPALWNAHQFSSDSLTEFPDCSVEGDKAWYGKEWVRALDGSSLEAFTRCGVNVASGDYTNPDEMQFFVWSFDRSEPSLADGCVAQLPSSRWATLDCNTALPFACLKNDDTDGTQWLVDLNVSGSSDKATCPEGYSFAAPHNGYSNNLLSVKGVGQTIWVKAPNPLKK